MLDIDQNLALRLINIIGSCGALLCSLEYLITHPLLADTKLLSWSVHRLRYKLLTHGLVATILSAILSYPNVLILLAIQSVLALLLFAGSLFGILSTAVVFLLTSGTTLTLLIFALRFPYGKEGTDQMLVIIFVTLALGYAFNSPVIFDACLWFLAIQACIAYSAAGIAKMTSPIWCSGEALPTIMATSSFGHRSFFIWLQAHPISTKFLTWTTLGLETLFPFILLVPWWLRLPWLLWGLVFHASNAIFMRLNRFIWAFAATYPAIWYCASTIHLLK